MLDFKAELSKFKPLPEAGQTDKYGESAVEDIVDILNEIRNNK